MTSYTQKLPQAPQPEVALEVQLPESKEAVANHNSTDTVNGHPLAHTNMGGSASNKIRPLGRKGDVIHVILRLLCMVSSVTAVSFMVTARQSSNISFLGLMLPINAKWSFSHSFEYLVGVSAVVAGHSFLQFLISATTLLRKSPVIPSRSRAWIVFAADQFFAYAMISAGGAASGVTDLNHTGIKHTPLPNLCKPLRSFCDHVGVSIFFTFLGCLFLAASAVQEVVWLSKSKT